MKLTKEEKQELTLLLDTVRDTIPGAATDRLWKLYQRATDITKPKPCTCSPKQWVDVLNHLRSLV